MAGHPAQLVGQRLHLVAEPLVQPLQFVDVDADTDVFHLGEHEHERVLDRVVQLGHALGFDAVVDRVGEVVHGERVTAGHLGVAERRAVEIELAAAGRIVGRTGELRVLLDQVGQRVTRLGRIDQVGGDRSVERETLAPRRRSRAANASTA